MAQRARIGLPFNYDESWIGGAYYVQNLVACLGLLPMDKQPDVFVLSHDRKSYDFVEASGYPRVEWVQPARLKDIDGGLFRKLRFLQRVVPAFLKRRMTFDVIYPFPIDRQARQTVCWIPDLQQKHLPELFDQAELEMRDKEVRYYFENFDHIVFSSATARADFHKFYPEATCTTHVVHFAVFAPQATLASANVCRKHGLPTRFFYCPNQFWIHKNHKVALEAMARLKGRGIEVAMVFSGKEHDHRAPHHTRDLKDMARRVGINNHTYFLGFLPREEQVTLFSKAIAIVQPSLFEGWSTVIEDAKAVSQYVIASDLVVNREQIDTNVSFFDPHDPEALADLLEAFATDDPKRVEHDYTVNQRAFAEDFMSVVDHVRGSLSVL